MFRDFQTFGVLPNAPLAAEENQSFGAIGITVFVIVVIGFSAAMLRNVLKSREELGSEIELAPNRREYLPDEELEGTKLDRSLTFSLVLLTFVGLALPFYWLAEPGRQAGAEVGYTERFEREGEALYKEGAQCVNCHSPGGVGGPASYVLQDADGQFLANATWTAPALDTLLLRYSEDEVRYVLNYGRPGSPMAAWGTPGGGPLTPQQVDSIIVYLRTLQKPSLDPIAIAAAGGDDPQDIESLKAKADADELRDEIVAEVERSIDDKEFETIGEAVFNLGLYSGEYAGALSCGRCHTAGWSLGATNAPNVLKPGIAGCGGGDPSGIGFNLCGEGLKKHFPDDTWLQPDGSWYELANFDTETKVTEQILGSPEGYDGTYILSQSGSKIKLSDKGKPVTATDDPYIVLGPERDENGEIINRDRDGDLASCKFVSKIWEAGGKSYPIAPLEDGRLPTDADGEPVDPEEITLETPGLVSTDDLQRLEDGRIVGDCQIVEMPPRTSQAQYDFVYNGAEQGKGYGRGGMSAAGLMPGFGEILPPEYIQAAVDYERSLSAQQTVSPANLGEPSETEEEVAAADESDESSASAGPDTTDADPASSADSQPAASTSTTAEVTP